MSAKMGTDMQSGPMKKYIIAGKMATKMFYLIDTLKMSQANANI